MRELIDSDLPPTGSERNDIGAAVKACRQEKGGEQEREQSQSDILVSLAADATLFHAHNGKGYADLKIKGHRETWPIRSRAIKHWLMRQFYEATGRAAASESLQSAINLLEAKAQFDGANMEVHVRIGGCEGKLYLDLVDDAWRAVEIDDTGWRVVDDPPVRFRRTDGMRPLPAPVPGGAVEMLRTFLNIGKDNDFVLAVAWILAAFHNKGPYPILVLSGEQGAAKSSFSGILRGLVDPNSAPLRAMPRGDRDLFIMANNGHVLAFDNVSALAPWLSDTFCRLATGGGFSVRQLYTDDSETLFDAARPIILNGIEDIVNRPDLADRAIFLTLEPIPDNRRKPEKQLWGEFEKARPMILGALLDAVSVGLQRLPETRLDKLPRMADFALWATACESAFGGKGTFEQAYSGNRDEAVESVIEADPVASGVRSLITAREEEWAGTASELLNDLSGTVSEATRISKSWPSTPRTLANRLRRAATFLRKIGIEVDHNREGKAGSRIIRISRSPTYHPILSSASSASSANQEKRQLGNGLGGDCMLTQTQEADPKEEDPDPSIVSEKALDFKVPDDADDADAKVGTSPVVRGRI